MSDDQLRDAAEYIKARYGDSSIDWSKGWYERGGYVGDWVPNESLVWISPDECLISATDVRVMRMRCSRAGHPTPTSDCGKPGARIEPPEQTA